MSSAQLKFPPAARRLSAARGRPENAPDREPLRPAVIARGRGLAIDPSYPEPKVILVVGERLVKLFQ